MQITRREIIIGSSLVALSAITPVKAQPRSQMKVTACHAKPICIIPAIDFSDHVSRTIFDNTYTLHYEIMDRFDFRAGRVERARVGSKRYATWLRDEEYSDGIPPHIQFGGCVVAGPGDPEFRNRWVSYARSMVSSGKWA